MNYLPKLAHYLWAPEIKGSTSNVNNIRLYQLYCRYRSEGRIIFYLDEMIATEFKRKKMVSARVRDSLLQKECFNEFLFEGGIDLPTIEDEHIIIVSCSKFVISM